MPGRSATGPLAGVRVLDFTQMLSGPFATMLLAAILDAEARRARALGRNDPDELRRALGLLRTTGAAARIARAEADLGTMTGDDDLRDGALRRLEELGDIEYVERLTAR